MPNKTSNAVAQPIGNLDKIAAQHKVISDLRAKGVPDQLIQAHVPDTDDLASLLSGAEKAKAAMNPIGSAIGNIAAQHQVISDLRAQGVPDAFIQAHLPNTDNAELLKAGADRATIEYKKALQDYAAQNGAPAKAEDSPPAFSGLSPGVAAFAASLKLSPVQSNASQPGISGLSSGVAAFAAGIKFAPVNAVDFSGK